ncbi:hypothetical protein QE152_g35778, partial [Popillia japonica]
VVKDI